MGWGRPATITLTCTCTLSFNSALTPLARPTTAALTFIFDLTPTLAIASPASRLPRLQACAGFMAAAGTAPRLHPAYSLGVEELGVALAHCGMRPLHSALATTSSSEKA